MPKLKTNRAAKKRYSLQQQEKLKEQNQIEDIYQQTKQKDKKNQEKFKMVMQTRVVKIQLKNYYHMVDNKIKIIRQKFKEGEYKWQE